jgi:hypothetical protein
MSPTDILKAAACEAIEEHRAWLDHQDGLKKLTLEMFKVPGQRSPDCRIIPEIVRKGAP